MKKMCTRKFSILAILTAFAITGFSQTIPPDIRDMMPGNSATAAPDKKPGVIRIGVSSPVAEMGKDFNFADAPMAIRNTLEVALTDDNVEVIFLESALPEKEAKLKKCDYIFISKVTRKKGGGGFGGMGMLGGMAGMIPALVASQVPSQLRRPQRPSVLRRCRADSNPKTKFPSNIASPPLKAQ